MSCHKIKNLLAIAFVSSFSTTSLHSYAADKQQTTPQAKSGSQNTKKAKTDNAEANSKIYDQALDAYKSKNYAKAIELLIPIAEKGFAKAQALLGMAYQFGGTGNDRYVEAQRWYEKAYENGIGGATANNLGSLLRSGYGGVTRDAVKAEKVLKDAGEDKFSYFNLASLYLESPELFNEKNLLTALEYAKGAEKLGNEYMKEIISTIECALNPNAKRKYGWFNSQGLEAYDLVGRVMTVKYSNGYSMDGYFLFGKSGNLIVARSNYSLTQYRYDSSCNLITETRIAPNKGDVLQEMTYQYVNDRLDYKRFSNGSTRYVYSTQPDGSLFVTEDSVQKMAYGGDHSQTNSNHYDRSGRLIWSDSNGYPPFGQFDNVTHELVQSAGIFYPPTIRKDYNGRVTYDKGFSYAYTPDGLLFRVSDRAGNMGQTRGVLTFDRDQNNMLKRETYRDTSRDEIGGQRNVMNETTYDGYQLDENRNWTSRSQTYQYQGKPQTVDQRRTITYW